MRSFKTRAVMPTKNWWSVCWLLFHDEDLEYAERLRAAGVPVDLVVVPGMPHGADVLMPQAPQMVAFNDAKLAALRRALVA